MLEHLTVRNYVLIDYLDIDFNPGFTVLSGETGSGKTIMLGALSLLLGAKADRNDVRLGKDFAEVSGLFSVSSPLILAWLEAHGIEREDESILIRRLIKVSGKGTYTVRATADLAGSNKIAVDVVKAPATEDGEETVYGTAYFTSNIAGVVTANESVEESVATMKVVPVQNAIRVTNVDKATYRIVSMTGAVVASGHINGDTYISTASLSQGIYIVAVEANGTLQSVKVKL